MNKSNIFKIIALAISLQSMVACANQIAATAIKSTQIQSENTDGEELEYFLPGNVQMVTSTDCIYTNQISRALQDDFTTMKGLWARAL